MNSQNDLNLETLKVAANVLTALAESLANVAKSLESTIEQIHDIMERAENKERSQVAMKVHAFSPGMDASQVAHRMLNNLNKQQYKEGGLITPAWNFNSTQRNYGG